MKVKYKEQEINIPEGSTIEVVNGDLVITPKNEFKRGDIFIRKDKKSIFIYSGNIRDGKYCYLAGIGTSGNIIIENSGKYIWTDEPVEYATKEESKPLFDALDKAGKSWNPETKQIEDILKVGDICIFWDDDKEFAFISELSFLCNSGYPYKTNKNTTYKNAIKLYSIEQYKEFLKTKKL